MIRVFIFLAASMIANERSIMKSSFKKITTWSLAILLFAFALLDSVAGRNAMPSAQTSVRSGNAQQEGRDIRVLEPDEPVVREIAGGQAHYYQFALATDQDTRLNAEQRGIGIVMTLFDSSGKVVLMSRLVSKLYNARQDYLRMSSGTYRLEVRASEKYAPAGRYEIKIKELRAATPQDETQIAVKKASADWDELPYRQASRQRDLQKYEEHLQISHAAGDRKQEATALYRLGVTYDRMGERQKSLDSLNQALAIWKGSGNYAGEAQTLCRLGEVSLESGEDKKASDYFRQAISAIKMAGDHEEELDLLFRIGSIYRADKQSEVFIEYYQQALELSEAIGVRRNRNTMFWELENFHASLGDYQSAANYLRQAREADRESKQNDEDLRDHYLNAAAEAYDQAWILQFEQSRESDAQAIDKLKEALNLNKEAGKRLNISDTNQRMFHCLDQRKRILSNIADAYGRLGEHKKAVEYLELVIVASRASVEHFNSPDLFTEFEALRRIGEAYLALGDKQKAMDYFNRSLIIFSANGRSLYESPFALRSMAKIWFAMGDKRKAHEYWDQSIAVYRTIYRTTADLTEHKWEWETLLGIAWAYLSEKEFDEALKYFNQCLQLSAGAKDREITVRSDIARLELERGNLTVARSQIETVLTMVESFRSKIVRLAVIT